jgi:hypothetical protein
VAENLEIQKQVVDAFGSEGIDEAEFHGFLTAAVTGDMTKSCNSHCVIGVKIQPGKEDAFWTKDPISHVLRASMGKKTGLHAISVSATTMDLPGAAVKRASNLADAKRIITNAVAHKVSTLLMYPLEEIDSSKSIGSYGVHSLVATEFRNWIARELEATLQILQILASDSLAGLVEVILKKSKLITTEVKAQWGVIEDGMTNNKRPSDV